jgi:uncharacterized protein (TIRG00374 family)
VKAPEVVAGPAPAGKRQRVVRQLLRLLGPILLVLVLLRLPDRGRVLELLRGAALWPLCAALLLNLVNVWLKVIRWQIFLETRGIHYPTARAHGAFMASVYLGMLTPGRVGDVLRVQYLRHDVDAPASEGLASIVMDRLCDLWVLAAFVAFGALRYGSVIVGKLAWVTWGAVALIAVAPFLLRAPGCAEKALGGLYRKLSGDPSGAGLTRFLAAVRANLSAPLLKTVPLTIAAFGVNYLQGWIMAQAMGLPIGLVDATCLLAVASMLGLMPISVSGVGVRELFFSLVFPVLGLTAAAGVAFGLMVFVVIYLANIVLGFISWQVYPPPTGPRPAALPGAHR